jgi:AraC-like DNA-binding protein
MRKPESGMIRLAATDFPEKDRVEAVREIFGKSIIKVDFEPTPGQPFRFDAALYSLPGLKLAVGELSPLRGTLTKELIESDDLLFNITLSGSRTLRQRGREATVHPGEAGLTTSIDPGVVEVQLPSRFISFRIPRNTLQPMIGDLDGCLLRMIPRHTTALRLLTGYASLFEDNEGVIASDMDGLVATHIQDLIALTLGATRNAAETARGRGVRAARLRAIKSDILENLVRADLSVNEVAARHGISSRYVSMLFAGDQTSFSEFVLRSRLDWTHRMLCDPRYAERPISAIAFASGFGDLSYFNRVFRRRFGATPSDIREAARRTET